MKRIIYRRAAGGLSIVVPAPEHLSAFASEAEALADLMTRLPAGAVGARVANTADLPADRTFRDAWDDTGAAVDVDMVKARGIQRRRIEDAGGVVTAAELDAAVSPATLKAVDPGAVLARAKARRR